MKLKNIYMFALLALSAAPAFGMQGDNSSTLEKQGLKRANAYNQWLLDAVREQDMIQVDYLLEYGADINLYVSGRNIILDQAIRSINFTNHQAGLLFLRDLVKLGAKAQPNTTHDRGVAYLIDMCGIMRGAAELGCTKTIQTLYDLGGDINIESKKTRSIPLHIAVINGHLDAVNLLLALGANRESKNVQKYTPFDYKLGGKGALIRTPEMRRRISKSNTLKIPRDIDLGELVSLFDEPVVSPVQVNLTATKELVQYVQKKSF